MRTCDTKVFYDTEFEATRAAAITSRIWKQSMIPYPCGRHWHIAHEDPSLWGKSPRRPKKDWCDDCKQPINPKRYWKHRIKVHKERATD